MRNIDIVINTVKQEFEYQLGKYAPVVYTPELEQLLRSIYQAGYNEHKHQPTTTQQAMQRVRC